MSPLSSCATSLGRSLNFRNRPTSAVQTGVYVTAASEVQRTFIRSRLLTEDR